MTKQPKNYGKPPEVIGQFDVDNDELMSYLYLPISMKGSEYVKIPKRLLPFKKLITKVLYREIYANCIDRYIYLTAKKVYVTPGNPGNRPGYHSDGFLTDNINYIWSDSYPTVFCVQPFDVAESHHESMEQFEEQAKVENETTYPDKSLIRLTTENIHRTPTIKEPGFRMFCKISLSKHKYNLKGNSHNYLFDYNWKMYDRDAVRNNPFFKESDFVEVTEI